MALTTVVPRKRGDTGPDLSFQILEDGEPAFLSGATVYFQARLPSAQALKINKVCQVIDDLVGKYKYVPDIDDFDTIGEYLFEIKVILTNGQEYTVPSKGTYKLSISDDLEP